MVRGLKKKLLIGLLSATVVGTSLAPNVPLVGSFAQEVKADEGELPEGMYKAVEHTVTVTTTYKWNTSEKVYVDDGNGVYTEKATPGSGTEKGYTFTEDSATNSGTYKKIGDDSYVEIGDGEQYNGTKYIRSTDGYVSVESVKTTNPTWEAGKYYESADAAKTGTSPIDDSTWNGHDASFTVYTREVDNTKSRVTVTKSEDTKANVTTKSIGSETASTASIDKNKPTKVTVEVKASLGKTIKDVVAKVLDGAGVNVLQDNIKATKVANADDLYEFVITATESTINVVVDAKEEKLLITPTLNTANLSSKVGTATLTSSDPVGTDGEFELKVTLEDGVTIKKSGLTVTVGDGATVEKKDEKNGIITYKITPSNVTTDKLEIKVSGRLDNDGLDTKKEDKGSSAEVTPTGNVAADANNVLDVAKSNADKKYVKAFLDIKEQDNPEASLQTQVAAITTADTTMKLAGYISITLYRVENDDPAVIEAAKKENASEQKVLGSLLTVHYVLPDDAQGKILSGYKVISIHDGKREITTTPNADGEYLEVNGNTLTLHVKKLSDFAVLYSTKDATTPEPNPTDDDNPAKEDDNNKGTITPSNGTTATTNTAKAATSTKAAKVTTSTKKSSKTSSPKTADYAVNSLLALLTGAAGLFGITLINKKRKEDEE